MSEPEVVVWRVGLQSRGSKRETVSPGQRSGAPGRADPALWLRTGGLSAESVALLEQSTSGMSTASLSLQDSTVPLCKHCFTEGLSGSGSPLQPYHWKRMPHPGPPGASPEMVSS